MFAFPHEVVSISSPCQVTCAPLSASIGFGFSQQDNSTTALPGLDFCTEAPFGDTTINNCAFCYGFIPQQLFLANCKRKPIWHE